MATACINSRSCMPFLPSGSATRSRGTIRNCTDSWTLKRTCITWCSPSVAGEGWWLSERRWNAVFRRCKRRICMDPCPRLQVRAGLEDAFHNQVLVSTSSAAILGQLVKPVTSALFGKGFNWKLVVTPGGMPSTHSASVTAAATAIGMDRGLSDPVFGLAVILASLVMYDAQGVRRSVGKQAEVINTMVFSQMMNSEQSSASATRQSSNPSPFAIGVELARDPVQAEIAFMEEADGSASQPFNTTAVESMERSLGVNGGLSTELRDGQSRLGRARTDVFRKVAEKLPSVKEGQVTLQEIGDLDGWRHIPLKESVGHTKLEVLVGAVWGILVALTLHSILQ